MMNSKTKNVQVISGFLLCADYTATFSVKWEKYSFIEWGSRSWKDEINTNYALSKYCSFSLPQLKLVKCMFLLNIFLPVLIWKIETGSTFVSQKSDIDGSFTFWIWDGISPNYFESH